MRRTDLRPLLAALLPACTGGGALIDLGDAYTDPTGAGALGVAVTPNLDDDDRNRVPDWADGHGDLDLSEGDADRSTVRLPATALRPASTLSLALAGDAEVRIWHDGDVLLGLTPEVEAETRDAWEAFVDSLAGADRDAKIDAEMPVDWADELKAAYAAGDAARRDRLLDAWLDQKQSDASVRSATLELGPKRDRDDVVLEVEVARPLTRGRLTVGALAGNGKVQQEQTLAITGAPLLLNHHLQESEHTWALDVRSGFPGAASWNNRHMIETYEAVLGEEFTAIPAAPYDYDVWVQDELQVGWYQAPGARIDLVIDSIRDRGLDDFPEEGIVGSDADGNGVPRTRINPDVVAETWGSGFANSLDSFGNLEVSPPVTVGGVRYPFGRIYYGGDDALHPTRELTGYLDDQRVQAPFMPDTTWLCVGHIDEVTSTVPAPGSRLGWKFVMADTASAWAVLDGMPGGTDLPRYARSPNANEYGGGHGIADVGEFTSDTALRDYNDDIQADQLDPMLALFRQELDLRDEDIILMPSLFERESGCGAAAIIPGMQNLIVTNRGDQHDVFLADPFIRDADSSEDGQDQDPMIAQVRSVMPAELDIHFVDNWAVYHRALGEVHCGTNMLRTPGASWWNEAASLLEGDE